MDIQAASIAQVQRGKDGKLVEIEDDVQGVANRLREISPDLYLRFSEAGGYFVVYQDFGDKQQVVTTATELDHRLLQRIEKVTSESYDPGEEADSLDAEKKRDFDRQHQDKLGDAAERLSHALRVDKGFNNHRAFVKGD